MTDEPELVALKYLSEARADTHVSDLIEIVDAATRLNALHQITGILFFDQGHYGQILEGPRKAVEETWARIQSDKRHHTIELLGINQIQTRQFPKWSMKLFDSQEFAVEFPKYADLIAQAVDPTAEMLRVMRSMWNNTPG
jgi:hypothetical protein